MKKILQLGLSTFILMCLFSVSCLAEDVTFFHTLFDKNFENISGTAVSYITSGNNGITTSTTNSGIKNYEFAKQNGGTTLKFTGYTNEEVTGNATRMFSMNFSEAYDTIKFPNTKLVVAFNEIIEKADSGSYTHTVINGTTGTSTKALTQMFWAQNTSGGPNYRCNNVGSIGRQVNLNEEITSVYVFDLANQTYDFYLNGNAYMGNTYITKSAFSDITGMTFQVEKNQTFSIDDIHVYTIAGNANPLSINNVPLNGQENVSVESSFEARLSTYIPKKAYDFITVTSNGNEVLKSSYTIGQEAVKNNDTSYVALTIDFVNAMENGKTYAITFGGNVADVLGNTLSSAMTYSYITEKAPRIIMNGLHCKAGIFNSGNEIQNLAEAKDKYVCFTLDTTSDIQNTTNAICVIAVYNENNEMIDCGFSSFKYEKNGGASFSHSLYVPITAKKVEAFACTNLSNLALISDVITFE